VLDVVLTGLTGTVLPVGPLDGVEIARAKEALATVGAVELADRPFVLCSEGERARALLARALASDARLLVLDEPSAGLDVGGRLLLLDALEHAIDARPDLTTITVTHELGALPPRTTHALLLRAGAVVAAGSVADAVTAETLAACFDVPAAIAALAAARTIRESRDGSD
jgi:iron complex transport system ATP-binding protein